jgi:CheY-like chemotaxis protein
MTITPLKTVLLVDDDLQLVKIIKDNLREQGYIVYCGFDGNMAVDLARKYHPQIILMDVDMPYTNGLQAFEHLRSDPATARIPVIFISGVVSRMIRPIIDSAPRAAHLKKPLDLIDLTSVMREFIQTYAA